MKTTLEARELRIGNCVEEMGLRSIITAENLMYLVHWKKEGWAKPIFKPISLTQEWLEKFGFEWNNQMMATDEYVIDIKDFGEMFAKGAGYEFKLWAGDEWIALAYIKYVHSLQNLYHSLTGEELVLKTTKV